MITSASMNDLYSERFSERAWRKYEPAVRTLIHRYNNNEPITFDPGESAETFICRCRDACRGLLHWQYKTDLDRTDIYNFRKDWIFRKINNQVYCGPSQSRTQPAIIHPVQEMNTTAGPPKPGEIDGTDTDALNAVLLLKSKGAWPDPVIVTGLTTEQTQELEQNHNVVVEPTEPGKHVIV